MEVLAERRTRVLRVAFGLFLTTAMLTSVGKAEVSFNRDIRPIMSDTCFRCHGPDSEARMAGMRLDFRREALKQTDSGSIPIVPGDPEKSAIIQRIFSTDPANVMPPPFAHKELSTSQKETMRRWVAEGARYESHWAYEPIRRSAVPEIRSPLVRNPIDAFIQERLSREGLKSSPEAGKGTLLRRVTLDLTGIPPTPEEMRAFLNDTSPRAYEKAVDRLLASPRYAEMQTLHWLDAVRYADSAGFHGDNTWPVWPYRDYVLQSFQDNKPFDEFTLEQLAGDLLPNATREQKIAATFNRLNRVSAEGGVQPKEYIAKYGADRVRTVSTVWMGATIGCAECHDHKFDPFTSKDFYAMKAFFADIRETGLMPDHGPKAWGSKLLLGTAEQQSKLDDFDHRIKTARQVLEAKVKFLEEQRWDWEQRLLEDQAAGELAWKYQRPISAETQNGAKLTIYNDQPVLVDLNFRGSLRSELRPGNGLIIASGLNPDRETYIIRFKPGEGTWTAAGVDIKRHESLPGNGMARGADRFQLTEVDGEVSAGTGEAPRRLRFVLATTQIFEGPPEHPALAAIDGNPKTGWGIVYAERSHPFLALRFAETLTTTSDSVITLRLHHDSDLRRATIGRFRIALSSGEYSWPELGRSEAKDNNDDAMPNIAVDDGVPPEVLAALKIPEADRTLDQQSKVLDFFAWSYPGLEAPFVELANLEAQRTLFEASIPRVIETARVQPRLTRVLPRGDWMSDKGEIVTPNVPSFLGKIAPSGTRATRLDLARWLVSKEHPLTARAFVNRAWRVFFGTGLSKVLEDLGSQGEWPTHPELLDWLAAEFVAPSYDAAGKHLWDVKHLVRTIVTSHTYRQSSLSNSQLEELDPGNRLLARQSRFRVEAEVVRDIALAVSGLLVEKLGGPSVRPYQPSGYYAAMNFSKRDYSESYGEDLFRRSLYTHWQRTFLHPTLATFDAPTREECSVNRVNSNTPLQALILLNDPIFVEAARAFAEHALKNGKSFDQQLEWVFQRALNREPEKAEREILKSLYTKNLERFGNQRTGAEQFLHVGETPVASEFNKAELAAMALVTRAILNLHETIVRN